MKRDEVAAVKTEIDMMSEGVADMKNAVVDTMTETENAIEAIVIVTVIVTAAVLDMKTVSETVTGIAIGTVEGIVIVIAIVLRAEMTRPTVAVVGVVAVVVDLEAVGAVGTAEETQPMAVCLVARTSDAAQPLKVRFRFPSAQENTLHGTSKPLGTKTCQLWKPKYQVSRVSPRDTWLQY